VNSCRALLLIVLLNVTQSSADAPANLSDAAPPEPISVHRLELEAWKAAEAAGWVPYRDPSTARPVPLAPRIAALTHEVHGYHPYWMGSSYLVYDWSRLSTIAFFGLELNGTGAVTNAHSWPWNGLVTDAHENGVRVLVTAICQSTTALDALLGSAINRQTAIANLVTAVTAGGADGVNVDFEGVPGTRKQALVTFLGDLRTALNAAIPGAYLSIATPAVDWSNAFDYDELAARCDHLMIMAYDYHWSGSTTTGPVSPLAGWGTYNVGWTITDYITWGAPRAKMLLGVPYYAYRWPAVSGNAGAATTATATSLTYSNAVQEATAHGRLWDVPSSTPWYREQTPAWRQGWYDDDASLAAKYARVLSENLAGVGVWALGYDGTRPELWAALANAFDPAASSVGDGVSLLRAGPNPFRDHIVFRLAPGHERARLTIHDVRGRLVRALEPGTLSWDGRDASGQAVAGGVYLVHLRDGLRLRTQRIVRLP